MLAVKNLSRRKIRTTLTVLGVAIGIASVVAVVAAAPRTVRVLDGRVVANGQPTG